MKNIIVQLIMIVSLFGCSASDNGDLTELIGEDVQSPVVKKFLLSFKDERNSSKYNDVKHYRKKGIEMHFKADKVLQQVTLKQMFLYSGRDGKNGRYMGKLPYNLSFDDTPENVHKKLGKVHKTFGNSEVYKEGRVKISYSSDPKTNDAIIYQLSLHPRY